MLTKYRYYIANNYIEYKEVKMANKEFYSLSYIDIRKRLIEIEEN